MRDLDGDGEPEAIVGGFTGGAHCCVLALVYRWNGSGYATFENNFRDPGYRLVDLDRDGRYEFRTADARFAFLYGSFAESVFRSRSSASRAPGSPTSPTSSATRSPRTRAGCDASIAGRAPPTSWAFARRSPPTSPTSTSSTGGGCEPTLRSALRRGLLEPGRFTVGPDGRRFIRNLKRHLRRWGYIG